MTTTTSATNLVRMLFGKTTAERLELAQQMRLDAETIRDGEPDECRVWLAAAELCDRVTRTDDYALDAIAAGRQPNTALTIAAVQTGALRIAIGRVPDRRAFAEELLICGSLPHGEVYEALAALVLGG
jgi:hypothetical protein